MAGRLGGWVMATLLAGCGGVVYDTPTGGGRQLPHVPHEDYVIPASAFEAMRGKPGMLPSLGIIDGPRSDMSQLLVARYDINGLPAEREGCVAVEDGPEHVAGLRRLCPIHPYFLVHGENRVHLRSEGFDISIQRWDYLESKSHTEIARPGKAIDGTFNLDAEIPEWPWVHGRPIQAGPQNLTELTAAAKAFYQALADMGKPGGSTEESRAAFVAGVRTSTAAFIQASELRGKPFTFLDDLWAAAKGEAFGDRPTESVLLETFEPPGDVEIFAGGTLARLVTANERSLISFRSTYNDGPWGSTGKSVIELELWFRKDASDKWVIDAVVPIRSTTISSGYILPYVSPTNLKTLFETSAF